MNSNDAINDKLYQNNSEFCLHFHSNWGVFFSIPGQRKRRDSNEREGRVRKGRIKKREKREERGKEKGERRKEKRKT